MTWRKNIRLIVLISLSLLFGVWWLFFGDEPQTYNSADVDYRAGTYEALFAKTLILPGIPLKRRDFEMRVVRGTGNGDIIGAKWQVKDRVCRSLKMPGDRIVLSDLEPVFKKVVCLSKDMKAGEPITKEALVLTDKDVVFCIYDSLTSFEPAIGKVFTWDASKDRIVHEHEIKKVLPPQDLHKHTTVEATGSDLSGNSMSGMDLPLTGELKSYADKLGQSILKNWHWAHPYYGFSGSASVTVPSYGDAPYSLYAGDKTEGDRCLMKALEKAEAEIGLPPIPEGVKRVRLSIQVKVRDD